jgi:hypothetical protein
MTEEELFEAARHIRDASDRAAYLERVCAADPALRRRVEALLRSHSDAGGFLQKPAVEAGVTYSDVPGGWTNPVSLRMQARGSLAEGPGTRIGPYKLLQLLGEGGMGAVYLAEQEQPVKRRVALKIIKADQELDAHDAAGETDQDRGQGGSPREVHQLSVGGSRRPEEAVRPDSRAERPVESGLCLGLRLAAPTNGSESRRQAFVVRRAGRFRRMSPRGASRGVGSGRDGVGSGSVVWRKSL